MVQRVEITDELDLHHFDPKEIKDLINEYIIECIKKEITSLRIIHGKGKGILRDRVHKILDKNESVLKYYLAPATSGSWGATIVTLKP